MSPAPTVLRTPEGARYARVLGTGAYRPARVITNEEICEQIDSTPEWILERSGIRTRHRAARDETVVDMAVAASGKALARAGVDAAQIGAVVLGTISHPYQTPAAAPEVAHRLGAVDAAAFDVSAACAGFTHGVALASDMVRGGTASHVLVIGVEKMSDFIDFTDRSIAFIFGDGAGAAVIGPSDAPAIGPTVWGADGSQPRAVTMAHSWIDVRDGLAEWSHLEMQGQAVFRWAVWQMAPVAQRAMDAAGVAPEDLGAFVPHQANMRITDAMVKALKLPASVPVARDVADTGNTSAASVPLALDRMIETGQARSGEPALLIGFGAGLSYAAQVVVLP